MRLERRRGGEKWEVVLVEAPPGGWPFWRSEVEGRRRGEEEVGTGGEGSGWEAAEEVAA